MNKSLLLALLVFLTSTSMWAQKMSYSKKSNQISVGETAIAQIAKHKTDGERSYTVTNIANGEVAYIFTRYQLVDTILTETQFFYKVDCPSLKTDFYVGNFSEINMQKAIAEQVIDNQLLNADGSINTTGFNNYAGTSVNYPELFKHRNDSLMEIVMIGATLVERNMRKPVEVNKFGKIGQDNTVIGTWEILEYQPSGFNASKEYCFLIKNLNGGLLAFSWIRVISNQLFIFDNNGVRKKEHISLKTSMPGDPIKDEYSRSIYVGAIAEILIKKGLL